MRELAGASRLAPHIRLALVLVLATTAIVDACGVSWGLPSEYGWAPDELTPQAVAAAAERHWSGGWFDKYPPLHFVVLAGVEGAAARLSGAEDTHHARFLAGRALSVVLALGMALAVFATARRLYGDRGALAAAAAASWSVPSVYYAKTANLDMPYVFWFGLALLAFVIVARACSRHADAARPPARALAAYVSCAAAAMATKDQAYALFVAPTLVVAGVVIRRFRGAGWRAVATAAVIGLGVLAVTENLVFNPQGFAQHLRLIAGPASREFRVFTPDLQGQWGLLVLTLRQLVFAVGWPLCLLAAAGLFLAVARARTGSAATGDRILLATLSFAVSYHLFFVAVVLYSYERFVLPLVVVLALFAGRACAAVAERASSWARGAATVAVAAALLAELWRGASVDLLLARDSRYAAERWLRENSTAAALVGAVGPLEYLPRFDGLRWRRVGPSSARLQRIAPDLLVVNADYASRPDPGSGEFAFYAALADGSAGYERVYVAAPRSAGPLDPAVLRAEAPAILTNLDKVSPRIDVYRRVR